MAFFSFTMPLGDMVEAAAKPIAKALHMSCLDEKGNLRPESGCAKRRDSLNRRWKPRQSVDLKP